MSAVVADIVGAHLAGQQRAAQLIDRLQHGSVHPDQLDAEVRALTDPHERRGLLRAIQKRLEHATA